MLLEPPGKSRENQGRGDSHLQTQTDHAGEMEPAAGDENELQGGPSDDAQPEANSAAGGSEWVDHGLPPGSKTESSEGLVLISVRACGESKAWSRSMVGDRQPIGNQLPHRLRMRGCPVKFSYTSAHGYNSVYFKSPLPRPQLNPTLYKGFTITARTFQVHGSGRWTLDLLIGRNTDLRAFSGPSTYPTEESAITGCWVSPSLRTPIAPSPFSLEDEESPRTKTL